MERNHRSYSADALSLISQAPKTAPTLCIGDRVELRSGGPEMLVVDVGRDKVTVARRENPLDEFEIQPICLTKSRHNSRQR